MVGALMQVSGEWRGPSEKKRRSILFPEEQDQARLHLRMGGRGGAPRAARFVLLGYIL